MAESPLILAIGDSLVAGYGLRASDSFAAQLQASLQYKYPGVSVINAGVSGDTTADVVRRLPRLLSSLDRRPNLAIVQVGPNDVLRQVQAARTRAQLEQIVLSVEPPAFIRDRAAAYLGIHEELAAEHGATVWPFFPPGVLGHSDMVLADRVHPNAKAISAVVVALRPIVERML
jgi:acyl-CoA thioesterase-1